MPAACIAESGQAFASRAALGRRQEPWILLGGSWDLVSKVKSTLFGAISNYKSLCITLVTKSQDPLSMGSTKGSL